MRSETKHFPKNSIVADSREDARGLMVITSGQAKCAAFNYYKQKYVFMFICMENNLHEFKFDDRLVKLAFIFAFCCNEPMVTLLGSRNN